MKVEVNFLWKGAPGITGNLAAPVVWIEDLFLQLENTITWVPAGSSAIGRGFMTSYNILLLNHFNR